MAVSVSMQTPIPDYQDFGKNLGDALHRLRTRQSKDRMDYMTNMRNQRLDRLASIKEYMDKHGELLNDEGDRISPDAFMDRIFNPDSNPNQLNQYQSSGKPRWVTEGTEVQDIEVDYSIDPQQSMELAPEKIKEGGLIPGNRTGDKNLALVEDQEFVLNRNAAKGLEKEFGEGWLDYVNDDLYPRFPAKAQEGGRIPEYANGGWGQFRGRGTKPNLEAEARLAEVDQQNINLGFESDLFKAREEHDLLYDADRRRWKESVEEAESGMSGFGGNFLDALTPGFLESWLASKVTGVPDAEDWSSVPRQRMENYFSKIAPHRTEIPSDVRMTPELFSLKRYLEEIPGAPKYRGISNEALKDIYNRIEE